jgi:hypothetical protein
MASSTPVASIWKAALLAGLLDIAAALIQYTANGGKTPSIVFKFIASGVFGRKAFAGGTGMIVAGFIFHLLIALSLAFLFFFLCKKWPWFYRHPIPAAVAYGIFAWLLMNLVILPLSNTPSMPFELPKAVIGTLILIGCIGLPLSVLIGNHFRRKRETATKKAEMLME